MEILINNSLFFEELTSKYRDTCLIEECCKELTTKCIPFVILNINSVEYKTQILTIRNNPKIPILLWCYNNEIIKIENPNINSFTF